MENMRILLKIKKCEHITLAHRSMIFRCWYFLLSSSGLTELIFFSLATITLKLFRIFLFCFARVFLCTKLCFLPMKRNGCDLIRIVVYVVCCACDEGSYQNRRPGISALIFARLFFFFCFSSVFSCETNLLEQIKSVCSCDRMKVYMPSREGVLTMIDVDSAQRAGQKPRQQHAILHCIVYIVAMATFNRIFPGIAGHNSELWIDIIPNDFLLRFAAFGKIIANTHVVVRNTTERNGKSCVAIYDLSCNFIFCALISAPNLARRT